jgi:sugar lactone lactonase YvrE
MRSTLTIALLAGCSSPADTGSDARTPFIPSENDDSGSDDSGDWRTHRVEPGDASTMPFHPRDEPELGRPWVDSGAPPLPVFDCSLVPEKPTEINELDAPRGYHDTIFDTKGNLIGSDGNHLRASSDPDSSEIWVANVGGVQGMDWLPDGDMVTPGGDGIIRINPEDGKDTIASGLYAYGVTVGPDGMVYVGGTGNAVMKLDPETGDWDQFVELPGGLTTRVTDFSPDYSKMYIGALSSNGVVHAVDLDENLEPLDDPYVFATGVGAGYHDGMGVDVCGNVYVNDYSSFSFYRITPGGDVSRLRQWSFHGDPGYGHGQSWGPSGSSVWREDAIYIPQPYDGNTVAEVVVEIPGRKYNNGMYEVINVDD